MHYLALAILPPETDLTSRADVTDRIDAMMAPGSEHNDSTYGFWDWWQLGGRWTGWLSGYNPQKDPRNIDSNGKVAWPTQWAAHDGDVAPASAALVKGEAPFTLICGPGEYLHKEAWDGDDFVPTENHADKVREALEAAAAAGGFVAVVDYHC